jgi:hypothetical protein
MPKEFQIQDLGPHANSGMLRRGVDYGIVEKVRNGWYRVSEGITDPWKEYNAIATKIRARGNPSKREGVKLSKRDVVLATSKRFPGPGPVNAPPPGPSVSIASYGQQSIIVVGKQIFIGIEVALVPKGGKHG